MQLHEATQPATATPQYPSLPELVRAALDDFDNDRQMAVEHLSRQLRNNEALLSSVLDAIVTDALQNKTRQAIHAQRVAAIRSINNPSQPPSPSSGRDSVITLAGAIRASLFDFILPASGKRLGDAEREDISKAADFYRTASSTSGHRARWLESIAAILPEGKKASEVLPLEQITQFWKDAENV